MDSEYIDIPERPPLPRSAKGRKKGRIEPEEWTKPDTVTFESRERNVQYLVIDDVRPSRLPDRRLRWRVPAPRADAFASHHHCLVGRVFRVDNAAS